MPAKCRARFSASAPGVRRAGANPNKSPQPADAAIAIRRMRPSRVAWFRCGIPGGAKGGKSKNVLLKRALVPPVLIYDLVDLAIPADRHVSLHADDDIWYPALTVCKAAQHVTVGIVDG